MGGSHKLKRLFEIQNRYSYCYQSYVARGVNLSFDPNDKENQLDEDWKIDEYLNVGADALRVIIGALIRGLYDVPKTILDFPCGSGRVSRHLKSFFFESRIFACDLYDYHVDFCVNELGTEGILSKENFDELDFGQQFDLIFCGSLLTHLPEDLFRSALRLVSRSLSDRGVAIITLCGRYSTYLQKRWKHVDDRLFAIAEAAFLETGFGYVDYSDQVRSKFDRQARYGFSMSQPNWVIKLAEQDYDTRILDYIERDWNNHQDVLVIGKPGVND